MTKVNAITSNKLHMFDFNGTTTKEFHPKLSILNFINVLRGKQGLNPGVEDYVNYLKAQGKLTALVTSAKDKHLNWFRHVGLESIFKFVSTADDGYPDKREQYCATMDRLGVNPKQSLAYEDSPEGVDAVKRIPGLQLCVVHNPLIKPRERAKILQHADYAIDNFNFFESLVK